MTQTFCLERGRQYASVLVVVVTGCTPPIAWDVPIAAPKKPDTLTYETPPDAVCGIVRDKANYNWDAQLGGGLALGLLGAATFATGTAVAAQQGHTPEYVGEWSALAGLGAIATTLGIYFIVRSSASRQEYWTANAAVAKIRADYLQYPFRTNDGLGDIKEWTKAIADVRAATGASAPLPKSFDVSDILPPLNDRNAGGKKMEEFLAGLQTEANSRLETLKTHEKRLLDAETTEQAAWAKLEVKSNWGVAASRAPISEASLHDYINAAEALRIEASVASTSVTVANQLASAKDAQAAADQTAYQSSETAKISAQTKLDALLANPGPDAQKGLPDAREALVLASKLATLARTTLDASLLAAASAHADAATMAKVAARATAVATDVMNLIQGQQLAWTDCSNALAAIGVSDVAPSTAATTSLSTPPASFSSGASKSSGK